MLTSLVPNTIKTHLGYVALIALLIIFGHIWLQEHDARVQADSQNKVLAASVATLQQQIVTNTAATAAKVQTIVKVVHDAVTPAQVVAALPNLTDIPLQTRVAPDLGAGEVAVNAQALIQLAGEVKEAEVKLDGLQQNYTACQDIVSAQKQEITNLKKKPKFFARLKSVAKDVGIGVGIGFLLAVKK